jgi:alcohol dehydrogenase class IV
VPAAIAELAAAMGVADAPAGVEELARLGGFERLRDLDIPEEELGEVAALVAQRPGARSNPRTASPDEIEVLLRSIW